MPAAKAEIRARAETLVPQRRAGDFTQAMMDLGATICTPKKPACGICPWMAACVARARGDAETFPRKAPKVEGRMRYGASFVVMRADGHVLVRSRPDKGPARRHDRGAVDGRGAHELDEADALAQAPLKAKWRKLAGVVEHGFTHFPLQQTVYVASVPAKTKAPAGMRWVALADLHGEALPNVMRKVRRACRAAAKARAADQNPYSAFGFCVRMRLRTLLSGTHSAAGRAGRRRSASPCRRD